MARVKFGWITPVVGVAESGYVPLVTAQQAETLPMVAEHFDSVWLYDHLYGFADHSDPYLECWTTLTWLAARFPRLQVGPLVLGAGFRPPALLAKMAATLQSLSGGRLALGLGAGWRVEEHRAYGYPFPPLATRVDQLDEAVQVIRRMWSEDHPVFAGEHITIDGAYCYPRPAPPPPIMIGGEGERLTLPLVARQADWWNVFVWSVENLAAYLPVYERKRDVLRCHAESAGRDPSEIAQTMAIAGCRLPRSTAESARWVELLRRAENLGVAHVMLDFGHVTSTEPLTRFVQEVIAPLNAR